MARCSIICWPWESSCNVHEMYVWGALAWCSCGSRKQCDANLDHEILQWFLHWNLCHRVFNEIFQSSVPWRKKKRENVKRRGISDRCCKQAPSEIQKKDRWQHDLATSTANKISQQLLGAAVGCGSRLPHEYHGSSEICIGVQKIPLNYFDCKIWKLFHLHAMAFFIHHLLHCTCVCAWLIFSLTLYWILCDVLTIHFVGSLNHIHHVWLVWFIHTRHVLVDHGYIITIYICTQNWVWFLEGLLGYFIV